MVQLTAMVEQLVEAKAPIVQQLSQLVVRLMAWLTAQPMV
jgi:hypothetical protein